jgi:hypothetical protein
MSWIKMAVLDDGLGLVMIGGSDTFGGEYTGDAGWQGTPVEDALPVECVAGSHPWGTYKLVVDAPEHPLTAAFDLEKAPPFMGINEVVLRKGAFLLAHTVPYQGNVIRTGATEVPSLAYWDIARGRGLALMHDWNGATGAYFKSWKYYADFCSSIIYYTNGLAVPSDMVVVHNLRELLYQYGVRRTLGMGALEFLEKFGGKVTRMSEKIGEADGIREEGRRLFLYQEYVPSSVKLKDALGVLQEAEVLAMRLKSSALLWIYLVEWLVVTATFVISATIMWSLMVKKKLYREIVTTRFEC